MPYIRPLDRAACSLGLVARPLMTVSAALLVTVLSMFLLDGRMCT